MTSQEWNADEYSEHAAFVAELAVDVLELLAASKGERILDLGCGDGRLTKFLQEQGCEMFGIDGSPEMIEKTQQLGLACAVMDGHSLSFNSEFDAVFSNAALHWMTRPKDVVVGMYAALKPGGRMVVEFGGKGNTHKIMTAISETLAESGEPDYELPWYFPDEEAYSSILNEAGFAVEQIELVNRPTPLESGMRKWLELFTSGITADMDKEARLAFQDSVCTKLRPELFDLEQGWWADYVRLRVKAIKPL